MAQPLAKVLGELDGPRGADVEHTVTVPAEWLLRGATIAVALPRNLACAACSGGGCDACGRAGAVTLRGRQEQEEVLWVPLPAGATLLGRAMAPLESGAGEGESKPASAMNRARAAETMERASLCLRFGGRGGKSDEDGLPRGNLLLMIRSGGPPSPGVTLTELSPEASRVADSALIIKVVTAGVLLVILFYFMLRLSGWL